MKFKFNQISIIIITFFCFQVNAQGFLEIKSDTIYNSKNEFNGILTEILYEKVIDQDGIAEDLYIKTYNYLLTRFNYDKSKIAEFQKEKYIVFTHIESDIIKYRTLLSTKNADLKYSIRIDFRDNRFKWKIEQLQTYLTPDLFDPSVRMIVHPAGSWVTITPYWETQDKKGKTDLWTASNLELILNYFNKLINDNLEFIQSSKDDSILIKSSNDW